jgi:putative ABC transport system substrate-binding protein
MMKRREFITLIGGAATLPLAARAQQPAMPVVGVLGSASAEGYAHLVVAFKQGLKEAGYIEGQNTTFEFRWADGQYDRLPTLAANLVDKRVALIAAIGAQVSARAAKAATTTIPIVFAMGADPVRYGIVASLNRPDGNITGATQFASGLVAKRVGLLHDIIPNAKAFGFLVNPDNPGVPLFLKDAQDAARAYSDTIQVENARSERDFDAAFARLAQNRIDALAVLPDSLFTAQRDRLVALAARTAIPTIYSVREYVVAGGLMSYGSSGVEVYRQAGIYTGRILKGAKPADLPVLLPSKFEFLINLKTAKSLGIAIPPGVLAITDEVIE